MLEWFRYYFVQQDRLEEVDPSGKALLAHHGSPCGLICFEESVYIYKLNMSNRNILR
jgi:hypothetical protein